MKWFNFNDRGVFDWNLNWRNVFNFEWVNLILVWVSRTSPDQIECDVEFGSVRRRVDSENLRSRRASETSEAPPQVASKPFVNPPPPESSAAADPPTRVAESKADVEDVDRPLAAAEMSPLPAPPSDGAKTSWPRQPAPLPRSNSSADVPVPKPVPRPRYNWHRKEYNYNQLDVFKYPNFIECSVCSN